MFCLYLQFQDSDKLYAPMTAMMLLPDINSFIESSGVSEEEKDEARKESKKNMMAMMEDIFIFTNNQSVNAA